MKKVCIVGMGFVGLTMSIVAAESGFDVLGVEINQDTYQKIKKGNSHFHEVGLNERLSNAILNESLKITDSILDCYECDIFIITVGTPLDIKGNPSVDMVKSASKEVASVLKPGSLVILRSTVMIGTSRSIVLPILNKKGIPFNLAFCPERTIEGNALYELSHLPQICGGIDEESSNNAASFFQKITSSVLKVSNLETAEMIKLLDNSYRDLTFAFGNEVAMMCEQVGLNAIEIINAGKLGYDRTNIALPGTVGGPCLSKDPHILNYSMKKYDFVPTLINRGRQINESLAKHAMLTINKFYATQNEPKKIVICGIAFKGQPETDDLRGTPTNSVIKEIKNRFPKSDIYLHDFACQKIDLESNYEFPAVNIDEAFKQTDLIIITNNNRKYTSIDTNHHFNKLNDSSLIYDFWSILTINKNSNLQKTTYLSFGGNNTNQEEI